MFIEQLEYERSLNEECGVFGVWNHPNANQVVYYGLHSLQHRGQEISSLLKTFPGCEASSYKSSNSFRGKTISLFL